MDDLRRIDELLVPLLRELIQEKTYITFLIGHNGEFDEYAASLIKGVEHRLGKENRKLTLVLPYRVVNMEYYEKYYDSIVIPETLHGAHSKSAIALKNRWMIEQSDWIIVYGKRNKGGAYAAMKYAEKHNKKIINLYKKELL